MVVSATSSHSPTLSGHRVSSGLSEISKGDPLWKEYIEKAAEFDGRMIDEWNKIVDVILVYVALVISVLTSFILETFTQFKRNPADISNDLLVAIYKQLAAQSNNITIPIINTSSIFEQKKTDHDAAILNNTLLYSSLALCTVVSIVALAAKMWLVAYGHRAFSDGTLYERAMKRQEAYSGILAWKLGAVINSLPLVLLLALIMFGFFIHASLWNAQHNVGYAVGTIITMGLIAFGVTALVAAFVPACPFHSCFSTAIHLIFTYSEKLSVRILTSLSASQRLSRWLRLGAYTFLGVASAAGITYATLQSSSAYTSLIFAPIAITFAYSLQEGPGVVHKAQKQRLPLFALLIFLVIASTLAAAGYFRNPQHYRIFLGLYGCGMFFLLFFGWVSSRMSKSTEGTGEIDAIAWILRSTSSQNLEFFEKATQIANSPSGHHYKPRLLELLMPLLSPLITSHQTDFKEQDSVSELKIYLSCLAQLSDFEDDKGSFWRLREDARRHPTLEEPLRIKLAELATISPDLKSPATEALNNFRLNGQEGSLPYRGSTVTLIGSAHSDEEIAIQGRHNNGYHALDV